MMSSARSAIAKPRAILALIDRFMDPYVAFGRGLCFVAVVAAASHVFSVHRASIARSDGHEHGRPRPRRCYLDAAWKELRAQPWFVLVTRGCADGCDFPLKPCIG